MVPTELFALWFPEDLSTGILLLILVAAFAAGWLDAVVGGGGLLQLPALLLIPGITPVQALATNKLASVFGTATSSVAYYRRVRPDLRTAVPMAGLAFVGSWLGASIAALLPAAVFKPVIVVALLGVAVFTTFRPSMGGTTAMRFSGRSLLLIALGIGAVIGFYDGILGPGTGTFLVIALVALLGYDFLHASAQAKIVNLASNLGALVFFAPHGVIYWGLGLSMAAMGMAGSYLGSRMAIARGTRFIRWVFLIVVLALVVKLSVDVWHENVAVLLG